MGPSDSWAKKGECCLNQKYYLACAPPINIAVEIVWQSYCDCVEQYNISLTQ